VITRRREEENGMAVSAPRITSAHARRFRDEGFFVIEGAMSPKDLETLRGECQRFVDERDREMTRLGVDTLDLCHRGRRYFVHAYGKSPAVERFLFSDLMAQSAQAALGDTVYLFNEQYVVKAAERGMKFGWHQDSGFTPYPHPPYLMCWIPLDDVTRPTAPSTCCPTRGPAHATSSSIVATGRPTTWSATSATTQATRSSCPPAASSASQPP
jgi:hypothetical protein